MLSQKFFVRLLLLCLFCDFTLSALTPKELNYFPQTEELESYLNAMPWDLYNCYFVEHLGWFWVDDAKDCVKDTIKAGRIWEPYIISLIDSYVNPGDTVIDIGAHMGTIALAMSNRVGPDGRVYAFEAERQFFRELVQNVCLNFKENVTPLFCWLGDEEGSITHYCGFHRDYSPVFELGRWKVQKRTLDSFEFHNVALIKIDVECSEDDVLAGARRTIMESRPIIIIEMMGGYGYSNRPEVKPLIAHTTSLLNEMNYDVFFIHGEDYLAIPQEISP